jgi:hypothetical protein
MQKEEDYYTINEIDVQRSGEKRHGKTNLHFRKGEDIILS